MQGILKYLGINRMKGNFFGGSSILAASFTWFFDATAAEWIGAFSALVTACAAAYFYYWHAQLKRAEIDKIRKEITEQLNDQNSNP